MMWLSLTTKENKHERKMFAELCMVLKMNNGEKKPFRELPWCVPIEEWIIVKSSKREWLLKKKRAMGYKMNK